MESSCADTFANSPLHKEDINLIGSTNLSVSEKHHLRMLLHCMECFKKMTQGSEKGLIPGKEVWIEWCLKNPIMLNDDEFVQILLEQFTGAAVQLERLSDALKVAPLNLTLRDLIDAYESSHLC
tara:strand:- start:277 stop:648 length:372 start_codon:yes stop_codon:yes gene_type:complete